MCIRDSWIGDYMKADREYALTYRGEPRIDANDIVFLENRYVADLLLRIYDHTLNCNGALSGSMKARRDMSNEMCIRDRMKGIQWLAKKAGAALAAAFAVKKLIDLSLIHIFNMEGGKADEGQGNEPDVPDGPGGVPGAPAGGA